MCHFNEKYLARSASSVGYYGACVMFQGFCVSHEEGECYNTEDDYTLCTDDDIDLEGCVDKACEVPYQDHILPIQIQFIRAWMKGYDHLFA